MIKWKWLIVTALACLLPILLGMAMWDRLPDTMAIHFDINNTPDTFASKGFVVLGLPIIMTVVQVILCITTDLNVKKHGDSKMVDLVTKWIIPVVTMALYVVTLLVGLGYNVDTRRVCAVVIGGVMLVTGACLPKLDYVKSYDVDKETAKRINKLAGILMSVVGVLFFVSLLFPPEGMMVCIGLLAVSGIVISVYASRISKGM